MPQAFHAPCTRFCPQAFHAPRTRFYPSQAPAYPARQVSLLQLDDPIAVDAVVSLVLIYAEARL